MSKQRKEAKKAQQVKVAYKNERERCLSSSITCSSNASMQDIAEATRSVSIEFMGRENFSYSAFKKIPANSLLKNVTYKPPLALFKLKGSPRIFDAIIGYDVVHHGSDVAESLQPGQVRVPIIYFNPNYKQLHDAPLLDPNMPFNDKREDKNIEKKKNLDVIHDAAVRVMHHFVSDFDAELHIDEIEFYVAEPESDMNTPGCKDKIWVIFDQNAEPEFASSIPKYYTAKKMEEHMQHPLNLMPEPKPKPKPKKKRKNKKKASSGEQSVGEQATVALPAVNPDASAAHEANQGKLVAAQQVITSESDLSAFTTLQKLNLTTDPAGCYPRVLFWPTNPSGIISIEELPLPLTLFAQRRVRLLELHHNFTHILRMHGEMPKCAVESETLCAPSSSEPAETGTNASVPTLKREQDSEGCTETESDRAFTETKISETPETPILSDVDNKTERYCMSLRSFNLQDSGVTGISQAGWFGLDLDQSVRQNAQNSTNYNYKNPTEIMLRFRALESLVLNLEGQVSKLQASHARLQEDNERLQLATTQLTSLVLDLQTSNTQLTSLVLDLQTSNTRLESEVSNLTNLVLNLQTSTTQLTSLVLDLQGSNTRLEGQVTTVTTWITNWRAIKLGNEHVAQELRGTVDSIIFRSLIQKQLHEVCTELFKIPGYAYTEKIGGTWLTAGQYLTYLKHHRSDERFCEEFKKIAKTDLEKMIKFLDKNLGDLNKAHDFRKADYVQIVKNSPDPMAREIYNSYAHMKGLPSIEEEIRRVEEELYLSGAEDNAKE